MIGFASVVISSVMNRFLMVHGLDTIGKFVRSCAVISPPECLADFIPLHFLSFRCRYLTFGVKILKTTFYATFRVNWITALFLRVFSSHE